MNHYSIAFSLLVCLAGLAIYGLAAPPRVKTAEVGRIMFGVGLLVFLLQVGPVLTLLFKN